MKSCIFDSLLCFLLNFILFSILSIKPIKAEIGQNPRISNNSKLFLINIRQYYCYTCYYLIVNNLEIREITVDKYNNLIIMQDK